MPDSTSQEISYCTELSLPPPPYNAIVYILNTDEFDSQNLPPSYIDAINSQRIELSNYPGPPLSDGFAHNTEHCLPTPHESFISRNLGRYLIINVIITVILGLLAIGIQISLVIKRGNRLYYFGFWGGGLIMMMALNTLLLYKRHQKLKYARLHFAFFWQSVLATLLLCFGIITVCSVNCNTSNTNNYGDPSQCKDFHKVLSGFLVVSFAIGLLQAVVNLLMFHSLKASAH